MKGQPPDGFGQERLGAQDGTFRLQSEQARMSISGAPDAQACGLQAVGYSAG